MDCLEKRSVQLIAKWTVSVADLIHLGRWIAESIICSWMRGCTFWYADALCLRRQLVKSKLCIEKSKQTDVRGMSGYVELAVAKRAHVVIPPTPQRQKKHRF